MKLGLTPDCNKTQAFHYIKDVLRGLLSHFSQVFHGLVSFGEQQWSLMMISFLRQLIFHHQQPQERQNFFVPFSIFLPDRKLWITSFFYFEIARSIKILTRCGLARNSLNQFMFFKN